MAPAIIGIGGPHLLGPFDGEVAVPRDRDDLPQLDVIDGAATQHVDPCFM